MEDGLAEGPGGALAGAGVAALAAHAGAIIGAVATDVALGSAVLVAGNVGQVAG